MVSVVVTIFEIVKVIALTILSEMNGVSVAAGLTNGCCSVGGSS